MAKAKKKGKKRRSAAQKAATRRMIAANRRARHNPSRKKRGSSKRRRKGGSIRRTKRMLGRVARRKTGRKTRSFRVKGRMLIATTRNRKSGRRRKHWVLAVRSNPAQKAQKKKAHKAEAKLRAVAKRRGPQELKATASAVAQGFSALDSRLTHVESVQKQHTAQIRTLDSHMRNVRGRVVAVIAAQRGHSPARLVEGARKGAFHHAMSRRVAAEREAYARELADERHRSRGSD